MADTTDTPDTPDEKENAAAAASPPLLHHTNADEAYRDQQALAEMQRIEALAKKSAGVSGEVSQAYDRLQRLTGWETRNVKAAMKLDAANPASALKDLRQQLEILEALGSPVVRQIDLFDDKTPGERVAYQEGLRVGRRRLTADNPYPLDSVNGQKWMQGEADGRQFVNAELAASVSDAEAIERGVGKEGGKAIDPLDESELTGGNVIPLGDTGTKH